MAIGTPAPLSAIEVQIQEHQEGVCRKGLLKRRYRSACPRCQAAQPFAVHEIRRRSLRILIRVAAELVLTQVRCLSIFVVRWRCRKCQYDFTDYPDFRTPL